MTQATPPRYSNLPLPRLAHRPGSGSHPDMERLDPVTQAVPERLVPQAVAADPAFRFGVDLYNGGFFWEAHEVWEPVWRALPPNSRERTACRALIQGANALLKRELGRDKAFLRLMDAVASLVGETGADGEPVCGVDMGVWADGLGRLAADGAADGFPKIMPVPRGG